MKRLMIITLIFLILSVFIPVQGGTFEPDKYKPAVYYPVLWKLFGPSLYDNPNCVSYQVFTSQEELKNHLYQVENWAQDQASDAANFIFNVKNSNLAYVYTYMWYYDEYWNSFHDNYFMYREAPDTEAVIVGVSSTGVVTSFVTHPHYTLQKYDSPSLIDQTHPILYLRGAHHGPYQTEGIGNTFAYWGYIYNLQTYYPAVVK